MSLNWVNGGLGRIEVLVSLVLVYVSYGLSSQTACCNLMDFSLDMDFYKLL